MPIHPEYRARRRKAAIISGCAIVLGLCATIIPFIPGLIFIVLGLSLISLQSRVAHQLLARIRAQHPAIESPLQRLETWLTSLFNLGTHTHEYCTITRRDGVALTALIEVSRIGSGVAVLLHSASGTFETPVMEVCAESLRARGLTVVRFAAHHSISHPTDHVVHLTATDFLHDLEDIIAWCKTQPWGSGPLVLAGHSIGGLVAGVYAYEHPEQVSELVLVAPTLSGDSYARAYAACDPDGLLAWKRDGTRPITHPLTGETFMLAYAFVEDALQYDLRTHAHLLTMPTRIFVGSIDHTAPAAECEHFAHELGVAASCRVLPDVPHAPAHHQALQTLRTALLS